MVFPFAKVIPEIVAVTPDPTTNIRFALLPLIVRLDAPGPVIVRFVLMPRVLSSVIVPVTPKIIVSPEEALTIALRSDPGPLSFVLVTVIVAPNAGETTRLPRMSPRMVTVVRNRRVVEAKGGRRAVAHVPSDASVYRCRFRFMCVAFLPPEGGRSTVGPLSEISAILLKKKSGFNTVGIFS